MRRFNAFLLWAHRWTGVLFALVFIIVGLSGTLLTFRYEIQRFMHPDLLSGSSVAAADVDFVAVEGALLAQFPDASVQFLQTNPARPDFPVRAVVRQSDGSYGVHYINAETLHLVEGDIDEGFWRWMRELHIFLVQGQPGLLIVFASGWVLMLCSLLGLWLWVPRLRKPALALGIRWRAPLNKLLLDLHNTTGVYLLVPMLVLALTGATLILARISPSDLPGPDLAAAEQGATDDSDRLITAPLSASLATLEAEAGTVVIHQIQFPRPDAPFFAFEVQDPLQGFRTLYLGASGRALIGGYSERDLGLWHRLKGELGTALHEGYILGIPGRWVVFICGLTLTAGSITGVWLWLAKRGRRRPRLRSPALSKPKFQELS